MDPPGRTRTQSRIASPWENRDDAPRPGGYSFYDTARRGLSVAKEPMIRSGLVDAADLGRIGAALGYWTVQDVFLVTSIPRRVASSLLLQSSTRRSQQPIGTITLALSPSESTDSSRMSEPQLSLSHGEA